MTTSAKVVTGAGALLVAAIFGGALISSAFAGDNGDTTGDMPETGAYCQTFLDSFAANLGVTTDELAPAAKSAAIDAVHAAVEAGDLSQERADAIIERITNWDGHGCGWIGFHLRHHGPKGPAMGFFGDIFGTAADALGMDPADLRESLPDSSLEQIAADQGVSYDTVTSAILDAAQTQLDAAVADGHISQDRADAVIEHLQSWLDDGGSIPDMPFGGRHHDRMPFGEEHPTS